MKEKFMVRRMIAKLKNKTGIDSKVVSYYSPGAAITEQYRNIRTYISSLNGGKLFRSLLITSANRMEGKSITCVNLAVIMAEEREKSTVLVSADFRNPKIEKLLNVRADKGLSNYLTEEIQLDEILIKTSIENLVILPAGDILSNPAEFFTNQKMKSLITELEMHFNYIIFDSPAIMPYSDARILAPYVDGVLLAVQAGRTRREVVWRVEEQIKSVRAKLLGVILTNVEYYIPEYIHRYL
ncbi:MAG: hypothetical protein DRP78_01250 [Candidatus Omnitrophota bacterium]|nr:MAG: hypothetical protein DRP78_01250 [Candidatus Omnitrophota bacterium]